MLKMDDWTLHDYFDGYPNETDKKGLSVIADVGLVKGKARMMRRFANADVLEFGSRINLTLWAGMTA